MDLKILRKNRIALAISLGSILTFFIGWFPHGAFIIGIIVAFIVGGSWLKRLLYSLLSVSVGFIIVFIAIIIADKETLIRLSYYGIHTLEVMAIQLILVSAGAMVYSLLSWIFNP